MLGSVAIICYLLYRLCIAKELVPKFHDKSKDSLFILYDIL